MLVGSLTLLILMKGHVGDGARSGELKAPVTGLYMPTPHPARAHACVWVMHVHSYPLRLMCRYRLLEAHARQVSDRQIVPDWCVTQT
jgi:hypothetical protein